jgi:Ni/Co efflux regulator RcnB
VQEERRAWYASNLALQSNWMKRMERERERERDREREREREKERERERERERGREKYMIFYQHWQARKKLKMKNI